jgi:hypothetical protein
MDTTSSPRSARRVPGARTTILAAALLLRLAGPATAQTTALLRGVVVDPQQAAVGDAAVRLAHPLTGFDRRVSTADDGGFQLTNVPFDTYELRVERPGFAPYVQQVALTTAVPLEIRVVLQIAAQSASVSVSPEPVPLDLAGAATRHQVSMARLEQMPAALGSRGLESVLVSFPGFAQNANGAIHPRGAHNQMTYLVDGLPISDQLTGAFANALDAGIVQSVELKTGNIPASFGGKVSGVAVVTTRSGLGVHARLAGDVTAALAGFETRQAAAQAGGERAGVGYFGSVTAMRTDRFLDQISLDNLHNAGAFGRAFARTDLVLGTSGMLRVNGMGGHSTFEVANLRSQDAAAQDQRQSLSDAAGWTSYLRPLGSQSALESTVGYRWTRARLRASAGDTPVTAGQDRELATLTAAARASRITGAHELQVGIEVQRVPIREHFTMGLTSPGFNVPGTPSFNPALLAYDLSRGGRPFVFDDARTGQTLGVFVQSVVRWPHLTLTLGARHDRYAFLVDGQHLQPRVGVAYQLPGRAGVVRASYNRLYQTPPNENLLLSSSEAASRLAPESVREALGGAYRPVHPERQHVFEAGFQRALGDLASLDISVYRKRSRDQQDNNNFFDTGIVFPTTLAALRVTGAETRVALRERRGLSGSVSLTTGRAIATPPFTGGLFLGQDAVDLLSAGPFPIDHDQRLSVHGVVQYDPPGPFWASGSVRYDSGLVANPSDPDEVAADPDYADLLPYVNLAADTPRVRPRTIADLAAGWDVKTATGRRTWSLQVQVTNLANRTALYNFQSVFVGTRLVQPRTVAVRVTRRF